MTKLEWFHCLPFHKVQPCTTQS